MHIIRVIAAALTQFRFAAADSDAIHAPIILKRSFRFAICHSLFAIVRVSLLHRNAASHVSFLIPRKCFYTRDVTSLDFPRRRKVENIAGPFTVDYNKQTSSSVGVRREQRVNLASEENRLLVLI